MGNKLGEETAPSRRNGCLVEVNVLEASRGTVAEGGRGRSMELPPIAGGLSGSYARGRTLNDVRQKSSSRRSPLISSKPVSG